jgi:hypothetical protein
MRKVLPLLIGFALFVPVIEGAQKRDRATNGAILFHPDDQRVIREYYGNTNNLPPGLAKRGGNLPPGLQKQLQRNGHLPPGLEKRFTPFPGDLDRRLPRLPTIYRRGTIGNRAVIVDGQNFIVDMMDLFSGR